MAWLPAMSHRYTDKADNSHKAHLWAEAVSRALRNGARLPDAISKANAEIAAMDER
jgi:hypothetical protein